MDDDEAVSVGDKNPADDSVLECRTGKVTNNSKDGCEEGENDRTNKRRLETL